MGQIVRRKKKGRPSKADLARRSGESPAKSQSDLRRSRRRRNVRYNIDYDDYLDEEEEEEEEEDEDDDEREREKKKLKLVVKLNTEEEEEEDEEDDEDEKSLTRVGSREVHALEKVGIVNVEEEDDAEEEGEEEEQQQGNEDAEDAEEQEIEEEEEVKCRKVDSKGLHSVSGTPSKLLLSGIPLPDKRTLELILDKLQKKDTYGVYAEPVDPEELPDYHEVIDHPMDFATVRKKLANGSYPTLEQFECDVFLICSNAMQYNAPETIYHKQARSIQELARKKFEKLRIDFERSQNELKSEQKTRSNPLVKKLVKKPLGHASQEPVGSDFSSGATLATNVDVQPTSHPMQGVICERPGNVDGLAEGSAFLFDANQDKAEDFTSGKGLSRLGRKPYVQDYERRATYNLSNLPTTRSDSILSMSENDIKQLVTVGLHAEYSYTRSLARFAATLGPTAWKIASQRIQLGLPPGCKFGHGWVGEYEPLPTPVSMMLDKRVQKEPSLVTTLQCTTESTKIDKNCKNAEPTIERPVNRPIFGGKQPSAHPGNGLTSEGNRIMFEGKQHSAHPGSGLTSEGNRPLFEGKQPSAHPGSGLTSEGNRTIFERKQPFAHPGSRLTSEGNRSMFGGKQPSAHPGGGLTSDANRQMFEGKQHFAHPGSGLTSEENRPLFEGKQPSAHPGSGLTSEGNRTMFERKQPSAHLGRRLTSEGNRSMFEGKPPSSHPGSDLTSERNRSMFEGKQPSPRPGSGLTSEGNRSMFEGKQPSTHPGSGLTSEGNRAMFEKKQLSAHPGSDLISEQYRPVFEGKQPSAHPDSDLTSERNRPMLERKQPSAHPGSGTTSEGNRPMFERKQPSAHTGSGLTSEGNRLMFEAKQPSAHPGSGLTSEGNRPMFEGKQSSPRPGSGLTSEANRPMFERKQPSPRPGSGLTSEGNRSMFEGKQPSAHPGSGLTSEGNRPMFDGKQHYSHQGSGLTSEGNRPMFDGKQHSAHLGSGLTSEGNRPMFDGKQHSAHPGSVLTSEGKSSLFEGKQPSAQPGSGFTSEGKSSLFGSAGLRPNAPVNHFYQQPNVESRNLGKSENKGLKQVELNSLPPSDQNNASLITRLTSNAPATVSKPREMVPSNMNILQSLPFKQPDTNGVVSGELPNGIVRNTSLNRRMTGLSSESTANQTAIAAPFVAHGQEQNLSDPVQLMKMLSEKAQKQQTSSSSNHSPADTPPVTPSVQSGRRDESANASAAAARAWMSVGQGGFRQGPESYSSPKNQISADSLYNPARDFHQHMSRIRGEFPPGFQSEKNNFPFQAFVSQPIHAIGVSQYPNRPMVFPQVAAPSDLSRFQMQPPWQGVRPHSQQPRQRQESLPPDLNIGFQSPGSPVKQSSGVMVDSQQPDLALQL